MDRLKICVYGAGAIGGYLAVGLARAGHDVCVIARGAHLEAIVERGLKLITHGGELVVRVPAADDPRRFGPQDFVICALMAHQAYAAAPLFAPLPGACLTDARLLRPPPSGIFRRSFLLHSTPLCASNDRRNLLAGGRPRYGDH